jgi:pSer/pThr/pTyr-binding forkhead associated (FHA) protein
MSYLIISSGGEEIDRRPLTVGPALIGRAPEASIRIRDTSVSRQHCRLDLIGSHWFVTDLSSKNGTNVNGRTVQREQLYDGDVMRLGRASIRFFEGQFVPAPPMREKPKERPVDPTMAESFGSGLVGLSDTSLTGLPGTRLPTPQPKRE